MKALPNKLAYELYFPEEVQRAGRRLFDLVEAARLPDVNAQAGPDLLAVIKVEKRV